MKSRSSLRIAVIGCGSAGPASAVLLSRQGHDVTLYERAAECGAVGAGFLLQPSGMAVLHELGILDKVMSHAAKVEHLHILDERERELLYLHYQEIGERSFGAGLHRPVLLHYLMEAMAEAGVSVRWGWEVARAMRKNHEWSLESVDGDLSDGFDLLIVADGARSSLRRLTGGVGVNRGYPWGAHWFIGKNHGVFPENELYQVVKGTKKLGGFLATGRNLNHGDPLVSLFWSIRINDDERLRSMPLDDWKSGILELCPRADRLLSQIDSWDQVLTARYGDVRLKRWHDDGVVILGDAAHAMSPQLGQGVNLALADASCLAECLAEYPLDEALPQYQQRRRWALRYYQYATRWLTPWFQSDHEWLSPVRKLAFTVAGKIPLARKLMTLTMAGKIGH